MYLNIAHTALFIDEALSAMDGDHGPWWSDRLSPFTQLLRRMIFNRNFSSNNTDSQHAVKGSNA